MILFIRGKNFFLSLFFRYYLHSIKQYTHCKRQFPNNMIRLPYFYLTSI